MEVRLLDRVVDLDSGAVRAVDGAAEIARLQPQPCRLLELLIGRAGEVVTHEDIRERLWPDVVVDYEGGIHFCIRQVRAALGDDAGEPRFVETLPRRGYRLLPAPEAVEGSREIDGERADGAEPAEDTVGSLPARSRRRGWRVAVLALLVVGLVAVLGLSSRGSGAPAADPPRLAILPLGPPPGRPEVLPVEPLTQRLLLDWGNDPDRLEVVGPTVTAGRPFDDETLGDRLAALDADYALHARYLPGREGVLLELIRAEDGAHVWVERYRAGADAEEVAEAVGGAIREWVLQEDAAVSSNPS